MKNWVDYREVKDRVRIADVVAALGVTLEKGRGKCPLPNHKGNSTDTFSVTVEKNVWKCFGCGWGGNVLELQSLAKGIAIREAALELRDAFMAPEPEAILEVRAHASAVRVPEAEPVAEKGFLKAADEWIDLALTQGDDETRSDWLKRAKHAIKSKLLESYKNGQAAKK